MSLIRNLLDRAGIVPQEYTQCLIIPTGMEYIPCPHPRHRGMRHQSDVPRGRHAQTRTEVRDLVAEREAWCPALGRSAQAGGDQR